MAEQNTDGELPTLALILAEVRQMAAHVAEIHAELEQFRPVLALFRPNGGGSDLQRAGVWRAVRKAGRGQ